MESRAGGVARARRVIDSSSAHKGGKGGDGVKVRERVGGLGQLQWGFLLKKQNLKQTSVVVQAARETFCCVETKVLQIMLQCYK